MLFEKSLRRYEFQTKLWFKIDNLFPNCRHNFSWPAVTSKLTQINSLPRAEIQFSVRYRNCQTYAKQTTFCVGRHIVGTFERVFVICFIFFNKVIQNIFHINTNIRIGIFVYRKSTRRMFYKEIEQSCLRKLWQILQNLIRNQVATTMFF